MNEEIFGGILMPDIETIKKGVYMVASEYHAGDYSIAKWSDWEAVFTYEGDAIAGEIHRLQGKES